MNARQFVEFIKRNDRFSRSIEYIQRIPERSPDYGKTPEGIDDKILSALKKRGIDRLYTHQCFAIEKALKNKNTVVVTPTASGKSITYLVPLLQRKIQNPHSRALLIFPTKALAQDQNQVINEFNDQCNTNFKIYTYDGDTPPETRKRIIEAGDFVITNPDMLHAGVLPHHTNWIKLFENLDYIVIDEIHIYRGVFGSHMANLLRRLIRIANFYGAQPVFLTASATIANPAEHAFDLTGEQFEIIDNNGAPAGEKNIIFYNPPVVNQSLGVRAPAIREASLLGSYLIQNEISTIFFCRSRLRVELLYTYLKEKTGSYSDRLRAYRGGYLPNERRKIEKELRSGDVLGVVSTNALELGVDIGSLDVSISLGYPGSMNSLFQQFGRAGRRGSESISILIATSDGTDQYFATHPDHFLKKNPEQAILNRDNLLIVNDHLKCAAYELPFRDDETFGDYAQTRELLEYHVSNKVLHRTDNQYFWMQDIYPANTFSLRSGPKENFAIIDVSQKGKEKVLGEMDLFSVPTMLHKDAIYIHQGQQYYVEELVWEERIAKVKKVQVDYFTDAHEKIDISILDIENSDQRNFFERKRGEIQLTIKAVMFKKMKLETHENLGWGQINTPEIEMHTQGGWILIPEDHTIRNQIKYEALGASLTGVAHALSVVSPVFVLCDPRDIRFRAEVKSAAFQLPTIYFYDSFPGGIGLSYRVMENLSVIAREAKELVQNCNCETGCPSCTGLPDLEFQSKENAIFVLQELEK